MNAPMAIHRVRIRQVRDGRVRFSVARVERPQQVYEAIRPFYRGLDREMLSVLCLDAQNQPIAFNVVSVGSLNTTRTPPVDILKPVILSNAQGLILVHNHPSGVAEPSCEDVEFTRGVARACELMGVDLYDHLILGERGFTSLRERGAL